MKTNKNKYGVLTDMVQVVYLCAGPSVMNMQDAIDWLNKSGFEDMGKLLGGIYNNYQKEEYGDEDEI